MSITLKTINYNINNIQNFVNKEELDQVENSLQNSLSTKANDSAVVHKTGNETIAGNKTFSSTITISHPKSSEVFGLNCKSTGFSYADSSTTQIGGARMVSYDNDGNWWGYFQTLVNTSNIYSTSMGVRRSVNGAEKGASMGIYVDANGNAYTSAPNPASNDNSTKIATTAFVRSLLSSSGNGFATYSKNTNGYLKFANGIIIQWGRFTRSTNNYTVTLPTAFSSTNYSVSVIDTTNSNGASHPSCTSVTTTTFGGIISGDATTVRWLAIGY